MRIPADRNSVVPLLACVLVLAGSPAPAAEDAPRGSIAGIAGAGRTWDDEGSVGTGVAAGGRVEWRLFGRTSVEGSVDVLTHERTGGFFEAEGHSVLAGGSLVQRFGGAAVRPYVLGGLSVVRHSGTTRFEGRPTERRSTDLGVHVGGGIGFRAGQRLEIGPEARFYTIQAQDGSSPAWAYWIGVRLGILIF